MITFARHEAGAIDSPLDTRNIHASASFLGSRPIIEQEAPP